MNSSNEPSRTERDLKFQRTQDRLRSLLRIPEREPVPISKPLTKLSQVIRDLKVKIPPEGPNR
jgi:hypothetical protein